MALAQAVFCTDQKNHRGADSLSPPPPVIGLIPGNHLHRNNLLHGSRASVSPAWVHHVHQARMREIPMSHFARPPRLVSIAGVPCNLINIHPRIGHSEADAQNAIRRVDIIVVAPLRDEATHCESCHIHKTRRKNWP